MLLFKYETNLAEDTSSNNAISSSLRLPPSSSSKSRFCITAISCALELVVSVGVEAILYIHPVSSELY